MLMRLALVLRGEAAGLAEEDREDTKLIVMVSVLEMCNNQPFCSSIPYFETSGHYSEILTAGFPNHTSGSLWSWNQLRCGVKINDVLFS